VLAQRWTPRHVSVRCAIAYLATVRAGLAKLLERRHRAAAIATIRERVSATVLIHLDVVTEWLVGPPALRSPGGKPGR
jgi:hypothetical protein